MERSDKDNPVAELRGVSRSFPGGVDALVGVDLTVSPGDYLSIMGPSGSGKSTLLNILGLLDVPSSGSYRFQGVDMGRASDRQRTAIRLRSIGFVFQAFHLISARTVEENIELPLLLMGMRRKERAEIVAEAIAAVGLNHRSGFYPDKLSGGERQRVAIGRALATQPVLVLADEPTGNLDQSTGDQILSAFERVNESGVALIMITHDPSVGRRANPARALVDGTLQ